MDLQANRPEMVLYEKQIFVYKCNKSSKKAIEILLKGEFVLIKSLYSSGLFLLSELKKHIKQKYSGNSFKEQKDFRSIYYETSNRILLEIVNNELIVKKAPEIGWLRILYSDIKDFMLPFPKIQGLNSSWQWYNKGLFIPVLDKKIFPYFGNYFPTRFEHLELFEDWLKKYNGEKNIVFDIGIGSGILSFQMLKHGFKKIIGTDTNPNCIIGLLETIKKNKDYSNLHLHNGNLFADSKVTADLIVFNPPWLPTKDNIKGIDKAIYYNNNLFSDFFKESKHRLKKNGKLVLLFSNLAQITDVCKTNPIDEEIKQGGRFRKELYLKKPVKPASNKTKRNQNWRSSENIELWVLVHK